MLSLVVLSLVVLSPLTQRQRHNPRRDRHQRHALSHIAQIIHQRLLQVPAVHKDHIGRRHPGQVASRGLVAVRVLPGTHQHRQINGLPTYLLHYVANDAGGGHHLQLAPVKAHRAQRGQVQNGQVRFRNRRCRRAVTAGLPGRGTIPRPATSHQRPHKNHQPDHSSKRKHHFTSQPNN